MIEIDHTIARIEHLYRTITGMPPTASDTEAPYAPIPPERDPVAHVEEQIERLLYALQVPFTPGAARAEMPPMSVSENGNEFLVFIDLPGVDRERLDVSVRGDTLVVAGDRPGPAVNGHRVRVVERPFGAFRRALRLPPEANAADTSARLKDGVLEIRIPRGTDGTGSSRSVPVL